MSAVGLDFDGVIHDYNEGWQGGEIYGEPVPGAFDAIRELLEAGLSVFIFTSREDLWDVAHWCYAKSEDLTFEVDSTDPVERDGQVIKPGRRTFWDGTGRVLITNRKYPALAYVDDRAVRFKGSWANTMTALYAIEGIGHA